MKPGKHISPLDIKGFLETSLIDWDGKIVCVVFLARLQLPLPFLP